MARVLLIEPDLLLARTYVAALQTSGHRVDACASAQAAIITADKHTPDVVVMEMQLIAHSGVEFLYEFRSYADWQQVPLIILTHVPPSEFTGSRDVLRHDLGVHTYLYKPHTSLHKLITTVSELVPVK